MSGKETLDDIISFLGGISEDIEEIIKDIDTYKSNFNNILGLSDSLNKDKINGPCYGCSNFTPILGRINEKYVEDNIKIDNAKKDLNKLQVLIESKEKKLKEKSLKYDKKYSKIKKIVKENEELFNILNTDKDTKLLNFNAYREAEKMLKREAIITIDSVTSYMGFSVLLMKFINNYNSIDNKEIGKFLDLNINGETNIYRISENSFSVVSKLTKTKLEANLIELKTHLEQLNKNSEKLNVRGFEFNFI